MTACQCSIERHAARRTLSIVATMLMLRKHYGFFQAGPAMKISSLCKPCLMQLQAQLPSASQCRSSTSRLRPMCVSARHDACALLVCQGLRLLQPSTSMMLSQTIVMFRSGALTSSLLQASTVLLVSQSTLTSHMAIKALTAGLPPQCEASALRLLVSWQPTHICTGLGAS